MLHCNLMCGTPEEVLAKLRAYGALGVDQFSYYASLDLGLSDPESKACDGPARNPIPINLES